MLIEHSDLYNFICEGEDRRQTCSIVIQHNSESSELTGKHTHDIPL